MSNTWIDIDQLLEDTKTLVKNTAPLEYIKVEIDTLLKEASDTGQRP